MLGIKTSEARDKGPAGVFLPAVQKIGFDLWIEMNAGVKKGGSVVFGRRYGIERLGVGC